MTVNITFERGPNGKIRYAHAPEAELRVSGEYSRTVKGREGKTDGADGVIYRLLVDLADAGYAGQKFEAHDGRIVCLHGTIDKKGIPVKYGGEKKES